MGNTRLALSEPGDAELVSEVRTGGVDAYGVLFTRHVESARRLARQLVPAADVDDLVSEAFAKVLVVLQRGEGPDVAFRAYLLTTLRRLHVDRYRATSRTRPTDDLTALDPGVPFHDTVVEEFEHTTAARAFGSLPERWQTVLWHVEVEGMRPAQVAPLLAISANSVSALAYRAREGLRQAYLTQHAQDTEDETCSRIRDLLGPYLRGSCSPRDAERVESHLALCRPCTAVTLELAEVNADLRAVLAPLVLGGLATAYLEAGRTGPVEPSVAATSGSPADPAPGEAAAASPVATVGVVAALLMVGGLVAVTFGISPTGVLPGGEERPSIAAPADLAPSSPRPDATPSSRTPAPADRPDAAPALGLALGAGSAVVPDQDPGTPGAVKPQPPFDPATLPPFGTAPAATPAVPDPLLTTPPDTTPPDTPSGPDLAVGIRGVPLGRLPWSVGLAVDGLPAHADVLLDLSRGLDPTLRLDLDPRCGSRAAGSTACHDDTAGRPDRGRRGLAPGRAPPRDAHRPRHVRLPRSGTGPACLSADLSLARCSPRSSWSVGSTPSATPLPWQRRPVR